MADICKQPPSKEVQLIESTKRRTAHKTESITFFHTYDCSWGVSSSVSVAVTDTTRKVLLSESHCSSFSISGTLWRINR